MSKPSKGNLLSGIPKELPEEVFETLGCGTGLRIERIVSRGHVSPEGFWYDQDASEWVMVVQGRAMVELEGDPVPVELSEGDYVEIPAHVRHRVVFTEPDRETVWLAVHYSPGNPRDENDPGEDQTSPISPMTT